MAIKIKLTRPELKRQRDALARFRRYLPMLKLKQQQLQMTIRQIGKDYHDLKRAAQAAQSRFDAYKTILNDLAGVDVKQLAACSEIKTSWTNIAGVTIPVFESVSFTEARYSLFSTPAWVDQTIADQREMNRTQARLRVLDEQLRLLHKELTKIIQRVNLFEKVKIPEAREHIRRIRIQLSDEMAAAVGRAKIAKSKLTETETQCDDCGEEAAVSSALV